jgi:hypothetical protein
MLVDDLSLIDGFKCLVTEQNEIYGIRVFYNEKLIFSEGRIKCPRENIIRVKMVLNARLENKLNELNLTIKTKKQ